MAPLALGDSNTQLLYTPVTPCRLIDTRLAGGSLAAGAVRDYKVAGTGLQNQGGNPAGCGVPFGPATAAMINFVVVSPVGPGNLRAWAFSTPPEAPPAASIINYPFGLTLANGVAVPICDPAHTTCPGLDLKDQADVNGAHLVTDVLGYFERFPKEEVKTFTVPDFGDAATPGIAGTCTHVTGTSVTINATTAGKVIVHGLVVAAVGHLQGGGDEALYTFVGNSTTDCAGNSSLQAVPSAMPTAVYNMTLPVVRVFDVAAGSYTYYLNALVAGPGGPASGDFANAGQSMIEATFVPN
jgi:hypothetical protein